MQIRCVQCGSFIEPAGFCPNCGYKQQFVRPSASDAAGAYYSQPFVQGYAPPAPFGQYNDPAFQYQPVQPAAYQPEPYAPPREQMYAPPPVQGYPPPPVQGYAPPAPRHPQQYQQPQYQQAPAYNPRPVQGYARPQFAQQYRSAPLPYDQYNNARAYPPVNRYYDQPPAYPPQPYAGYGDHREAPLQPPVYPSRGNPYYSYNMPQGHGQYQPAVNPYSADNSGAGAKKRGKSYAAAFITALLLPFVPIYEFLQRHFGRGVLKLLTLAVMITFFAVANTATVSYYSGYDKNSANVNYTGDYVYVQGSGGDTCVFRIESLGTGWYGGDYYPEYYLEYCGTNAYFDGSADGKVIYKHGDYIRIADYAYKLSVSSYFNNGYYSSSRFDCNIYFAGDYFGVNNNVRIRAYNYEHEYLNQPASIMLSILGIWQLVDIIILLVKLATGQRIEDKRSNA